jgi:hypothetical protein
MEGPCGCVRVEIPWPQAQMYILRLHILGLAMVFAVTTHAGRSEGARNDLEVPIPPGLIVNGVVLPHQMRALAQAYAIPSVEKTRYSSLL